MNDGYMLMWLSTMAIILHATGWREPANLQVPFRYIALAAAAFIGLHALSIRLGDQLFVNGTVPAVAAATIVSLSRLEERPAKLFVVFCSILSAMMWLWICAIYTTDPVFILVNSRWDGPLAAGIMTGMLLDRARLHYTSVFGAAGIVMLFMLLRAFGGSQPIAAGSLEWWDSAAVAAASSRITGTVRCWIRSMAMKLIDTRIKQRGGSS